MRVAGRVEFDDDKILISKIAQERAGLEQLSGRSLAGFWEIFWVRTGEAHFWTLHDVLKEPELERIKF
jgi:hypothetical protein